MVTPFEIITSLLLPVCLAEVPFSIIKVNTLGQIQNFWDKRFKMRRKDAFSQFFGGKKMGCPGVPSINQVLPAVQNKFVGAFCERPRANAVRPYGKKDRERENSLSFLHALPRKV